MPIWKRPDLNPEGVVPVLLAEEAPTTIEGVPWIAGTAEELQAYEDHLEAAELDVVAPSSGEKWSALAEQVWLGLRRVIPDDGARALARLVDGKPGNGPKDKS